MRYFVTASIVVLITCLVIPNSYALNMNDTGDAWKRASESERTALCQKIASRLMVQEKRTVV